MDAETILDEFADAILNRESAKQRGDIIDPLKRNRECYSELLPLIRAGLALQRLEKWLPEGHEFNIGRAYGVYGAKVWKMIGEHRVSGTGQTLIDAINEALDAAGEGT